ncbi:GIY-YIG nuclease family protein [Patescibacteria group bacterium]|nr:GIY-YIG nuclease family protein [Patescibacteria group bacterium]
MNNDQIWFVYIVKCHDQTYYTGTTNNLEQRIKNHNLGKGAKYTASRRPVELIYHETCTNKSDALKREYQIKQLSRLEKTKLAKLV